MRHSSIQDTAIFLGLCIWLVLTPASNVFAQGEAHADPPPNGTGTPTAIMSEGNIPTPKTNTPWTRKAAYRASTNQIVFHYGEGLELVDILAEGLTEQGYPAIAVPGGPKGKVEMFVGRKMPGKYTEDDLAGGDLGDDASTFFDKYVKKTRDPKLISLAK